MKSDVAENKSVQAETFSLGFLAGLLGCSLTVLWIFSFFLFDAGPLFCRTEGGPEFAVLVYTVCVALFFGLSYALHDRINTEKGLRVSLILGLVSVIAYEALFFTAASVIPAALASVVLAQFWFSFLCKYTQIRIYVGIVTLFCGVCVILAAYLDPVASFVFVRSLPVLSSALLLLKLHHSLQDWVSVSKEDSESRFVVSISSLAAVCSDGMLAGLSLYFVVNAGSPGPLVMIAIALILTGVGVTLLADAGKGRLTEEVFLKSYALRLAPFLLALPLVEGIAVNICACGLVLSFAFNISMVVSAHTERVRFNQLSSMCVFGYSFTLFFIFCATGWGLSMGIETIPVEMPIKAFAIYALLVVLIAVSTYLFQDQYPSENDGQGIVEVEVVKADLAAPWRSSTKDIAEAYGLSPRQTEVFELLAKGRNSEYISEEFYISRATAKAHINTIYKKIGVHSQQELINLVEEVSLKKKTQQ